MKLLRVTGDELPQELFDQMVEIEARCGVDPYDPETLSYYLYYSDTYLLMDGDVIAGFILVDDACSDYYDLSLHIVDVNIAGPYRRKGLAQRMIRSVFRCYAASHAGLMVTLDVHKTNLPARSLYTKLGFTETDFPSENGDTDVVMAAELEKLIGAGYLPITITIQRWQTQ